MGWSLRPPAALVCAMLGLAACGESDAPADPSADASADASGAARAMPGTLAWALDGPWRLEAERARDPALKPAEVAEFSGLDTAQSVLELYPGGGEWTAVLAPPIAARGGRYLAALAPADAAPEAAALAADYAARFADASLFGPVERVELGPSTGSLAEPGSIETALTVDDVATWMALGLAEKAFDDVYVALAPGGRLCVIQPRAVEAGVQDPGAPTGYVQQPYVVRLAEEAGFVLERSSELLANPADDADHPFGVWTLAPYRLTAPLGAPPDPTFDRSAYDAIGEPDRMALLFRKPRTTPE